MEYAGKSVTGVRAETGYSGASRLVDNNTFSPTQSLIRLNALSLGCSNGPPSQPQAVTSAAGPATRPSRKKSLRPSGRRLVTTGKPSPIPAGDHASERCRVDQ